VSRISILLLVVVEVSTPRLIAQPIVKECEEFGRLPSRNATKSKLSNPLS
jgi:hypothetical protein